jgi:TnpA family transposase
MNRQTDYGILNDLARHKTNNDLIANNWDDMLRATGSLQMGAVKASELIKSLHRPAVLSLWDGPLAN